MIPPRMGLTSVVIRRKKRISILLAEIEDKQE